jgi:hypothetical protein
MFRNLFVNDQVRIQADYRKNMFKIERVADRRNNPTVIVALAPGEITLTCERGAFAQGVKEDRPAVFVRGKRRMKVEKK